MNEQNCKIMAGLLGILISFIIFYNSGYKYILYTFNGFLYILISNIILITSVFIISKYYNKKEMIEWKYYL